MRKIKLYLFMITLFCIAGTMSACGKEDNSSKVTVYVEYNGSFGSEDEEVEKAIEEKFYKDTGLEIDLQIEAANTDMLGQKIVTAMADEKAAIDGFVNHYSSDGAINSYILDGMVMDLTDLVQELAPSFYAWQSFFAYLVEMSSKRNMSAYAGEVGYAHRYPENYGKITLENATRPFYEAVVAQRQTGLPLILFWNYDPTAVQSNAAYVYDRGTGIEYSFSEHSSRGKRILEIMKEGNQILNEMNK